MTFKQAIRYLPRDLTYNILKALFLGVMVVVFTFPAYDLTYAPGIDSPLLWVYNYLFDQGLTAGKHMVFPHGPLAFFMYPLPENILLSVFAEVVFKILLVVNLQFLLSRQEDLSKWLLSFIIAFFISILAGINHLILANLILIYSNVYYHGREKWRFFAYLITGFAFYVKAYVAILSGILFISYISYMLYQNRRFKTFLSDGLAMSAFLLFFWILMYGSPAGFLSYVRGMLHLAQDNSSAVSFYPENNWWMLSMFIVSLPVLLWLNRSKACMFYAWLIGLSLFAAWKHGMARQDLPHVMGFYFYIIICFTLFLVYYKKNIFTNLSILTASFIFLSVSITRAVQYTPYKTDPFRAYNFIHFITDFAGITKYAENYSREQISVHKLPDEVLDTMGQSPVDVYPWDYTYIPANNLRWQPRVVIQSYASYTSWLDEQNANHFTSEKAPAYIIWQLNRSVSDVNGGKFNSIDNRYLLNDEPRTVLAILKNYDYWYSNENSLILRKRQKPLTMTVKNIRQDDITWSKWCRVPQNPGGQLLRAKVQFSGSLLQKVKSFFYKDEQVWIYLRLSDRSVHKYRIVPKNAADGLWINPYLFSPDKTLTAEEIFFTASNEDMLNDEIRVTWESYDFDSPGVIQDFFGTGTGLADSTVFESMHDFEAMTKPGWYDLSKEVLSEDAGGGKYSYILKPGMYSATFSVPADSLPAGDLMVEADVWFKSSGYRTLNDVHLVISVDNPDGNVLWKAVPLYSQLIGSGQWNHMYHAVSFSNQQKNSKLGVYVWNNSTEEVLLDDFRVHLRGK